MMMRSVHVGWLAAAVALAGCAQTPIMPAGTGLVEPAGIALAEPAEPAAAEPEETVPVEPAGFDPQRYAARADGDRMLPAIDTTAIHSELLQNRVAYATGEASGTIVIDTKGPFLYLVEQDGMAMRYGIAIGREGFGWTGTGTIERSARWPGWTPPPAMIAREPDLAKWRDGMPGGLSNPLGARALYIYFGGSDSGYRIHGTNQPGSIGRAASSGCFRMLNQDVIDLYDRVPKGTKVVVI